MTELNRRTFEATAHSAISVVNAIPAGKGVTLAINIPCKVKASVVIRKNDVDVIIRSKTPDPHRLVNKSVEYALANLRSRIPRTMQLQIQIRSNIPTAVGLKSSSAVSVAATKAVFGLFSKDTDSETILKSSCSASKNSKASVTGAYDDASASLLGGLAFTDNSKFRLIKHSQVPKRLGSKVAILVPKKRKVLTSSVDVSAYTKYRKEGLAAFEYALNRNFLPAMLLNSVIQCVALGYSMGPVLSALEEGATAVGITGKGPAVAALCQNSKVLHRIEKKWQEENRDTRILITSVFQPAKEEN